MNILHISLFMIHSDIFLLLKRRNFRLWLVIFQSNQMAKTLTYDESRQSMEKYAVSIFKDLCFKNLSIVFTY